MNFPRFRRSLNLKTTFPLMNIAMRKELESRDKIVYLVGYRKWYGENWEDWFVTGDECQLYFNQGESNLWPNFGVGSKFGRRVVYPRFLEAGVR